MDDAVDIRVIEAVERYWLLHGRGPSYDEVAETIGRSKSNTWVRVQRLVESGYLEVDQQVYRSIRVSDKLRTFWRVELEGGWTLIIGARDPERANQIAQGYIRGFLAPQIAIMSMERLDMSLHDALNRLTGRVEILAVVDPEEETP